MRISPCEPARHDNGASDIWALNSDNSQASVPGSSTSPNYCPECLEILFQNTHSQSVEW